MNRRQILEIANDTGIQAPRQYNIMDFAKRVAQLERERCAELCNQLHFYHFDKFSSVSKAELVACVEQGLDDYAKLIRTGNV